MLNAVYFLQLKVIPLENFNLDFSEMKCSCIRLPKRARVLEPVRFQYNSTLAQLCLQKEAVSKAEVIDTFDT